MIDFLKNLFTEDFCNFILALSILMVSNAITGVMKAVKSGEFSWKALGLGVGGYVAWALASALCVAGLQIYGGNLEVTINDNTITLLAAIEVAKKAVYCYWSAKAIQNFLEYSKIDTSVVTTKYPDELTIKELYESQDTEEESTSDEEEKG